jgi:hypothetical protein
LLRTGSKYILAVRSIGEVTIMRGRIAVLAAALIIGPVGARGADLAVWWEEGVYPEENEAVREIVAAFEHKLGKRVELVLGRQGELLE